MSELKPCPFCGCPNIHKSRFGDNHFFLDCDGQAETEDLWNSRADEWISVDDRLPAKSGPYMTFNGNDEKPSCIQQRVHIYDSDFKWFNSDTVTHWKPLPEPPK